MGLPLSRMNIHEAAVSYRSFRAVYYADNQPLQYKYILEVVSWGEVFYIDYDIYAKNLDYFSNILSVY